MDTLFFGDFETAGRAVLSFLQRRLGFDLWMVTRTEDEDWIVLQTEGERYGVEPGAVFRWADSFCSEMVKGNGPRIAPSAELVPAYASAPLAAQMKIAAYIGVPLHLEDGKLFGTLCAIHPSSQPETILAEQELVELLGAMLSTILQSELRASAEVRQREKLKAETLSDTLTGLYNRRGWDRLLKSEEDRCRRYGHPAAITVVDIDNLKRVNDTQGHAAGDILISSVGATLRNAARPPDVVARLGGDEFGILSVECDRGGAQALLERIRASLVEVGVQASAGVAMRDPSVGLNGAWEEADQRMYIEKRSR